MGQLKLVKNDELYVGAVLDMYVIEEKMMHDVEFVLYKNDEYEPEFIYKTDLDTLIGEYVEESLTHSENSQKEMLAKLYYLKGIIEKYETQIKNTQSIEHLHADVSEEDFDQVNQFLNNNYYENLEKNNS